MSHPVDVFVGMKIRQERRNLGLTQQSLAEQVGIKFQQIQKYETGANRVSASRLWQIAGVLGLPIAHFFEGADAAMNSEKLVKLKNEMDDREMSKIVSILKNLDEDTRKKFLGIAETLSKN